MALGVVHTLLCPYCGTRFKKYHDHSGTSMDYVVALCDFEAGGCDEYFAARLRVEPVSECHEIEESGR
jgi:hypothetical protein